MNIEDYRDYCLSLGSDVEEAFLDIDHYGIVTLKCQPERIDELKAEYDCIGKPFNLPSKYWIGVDANAAEEDLLKDLTRNSYEIVKAKYTKKK